ncbi:MAG: hypothetical protein Kow00124_18870 [Anaerolineae bacterium]
MFGKPTSWLSPRLESVTNGAKGGRAVYAREPIPAGTLLAVWGGEIIEASDLERLTPEQQHLSVQVEEGLYMVSPTIGPADFFNHCCDPNAGMSGQIALVAMRDIAPGEEVCYDYAMSDGTPYDEFECECGAACCRGQITGDDWRIPELWERYRGYFSPYLQRRIDQLVAEQKHTVSTD